MLIFNSSEKIGVPTTRNLSNKTTHVLFTEVPLYEPFRSSERLYKSLCLAKTIVSPLFFMTIVQNVDSIDSVSKKASLKYELPDPSKFLPPLKESTKDPLFKYVYTQYKEPMLKPNTSRASLFKNLHFLLFDDYRLTDCSEGEYPFESSSFESEQGIFFKEVVSSAQGSFLSKGAAVKVDTIYILDAVKLFSSGSDLSKLTDYLVNNYKIKSTIYIRILSAEHLLLSLLKTDQKEVTAAGYQVFVEPKATTNTVKDKPTQEKINLPAKGGTSIINNLLTGFIKSAANNKADSKNTDKMVTDDTDDTSSNKSSKSIDSSESGATISATLPSLISKPENKKENPPTEKPAASQTKSTSTTKLEDKQAATKPKTAATDSKTAAPVTKPASTVSAVTETTKPKRVLPNLGSKSTTTTTTTTKPKQVTGKKRKLSEANDLDDDEVKAELPKPKKMVVAEAKLTVDEGQIGRKRFRKSLQGTIGGGGGGGGPGGGPGEKIVCAMPSQVTTEEQDEWREEAKKGMQKEEKSENKADELFNWGGEKKSGRGRGRGGGGGGGRRTTK